MAGTSATMVLGPQSPSQSSSSVGHVAASAEGKQGLEQKRKYERLLGKISQEAIMHLGAQMQSGPESESLRRKGVVSSLLCPAASCIGHTWSLFSL